MNKFMLWLNSDYIKEILELEDKLKNDKKYYDYYKNIRKIEEMEEIYLDCIETNENRIQELSKRNKYIESWYVMHQLTK
jgi:hypothetical protein